MNEHGMRKFAPYSPSCMSLSLALSDFVTKLKNDLADASGVNMSSFNVIKISPGSIIIDLEICAAVVTQTLGRLPWQIAYDLAKQVDESSSRLRQGAITQFVTLLTLSKSQLDTPSRSNEGEAAGIQGRMPGKAVPSYREIMHQQISATNALVISSSPMPQRQPHRHVHAEPLPADRSRATAADEARVIDLGGPSTSAATTRKLKLVRGDSGGLGIGFSKAYLAKSPDEGMMKREGLQSGKGASPSKNPHECYEITKLLANGPAIQCGEVRNTHIYVNSFLLTSVHSCACQYTPIYIS